MSNIKRTTNKNMSRVRELSTATKILITGNGTDAVVSKFQKDLDKFLDDLEALDAAVWKVIHQNKDRLYKVLDMISQHGKKKTDGPLSELREAWKNVTTSGENLGRDVQMATQQLRRKSNG